MTEIEVKISLTQAGFETILDHFSDRVLATLDQSNIFFDTVGSELRRSGTALRLRRIKKGDSVSWVVTMKSGGRMRHGVAIHGEIEEEVSNEVARIMLENPSEGVKMFPPQIDELLKEFKGKKFQIEGNFRSIRKLIPFEEYLIEADECFFPDGSKLFEIELETTNPEDAKTKIVNFLQSKGIPFEFSRCGKHGIVLSIPKEKRYDPNL